MGIEWDGVCQGLNSMFKNHTASNKWNEAALTRIELLVVIVIIVLLVVILMPMLGGSRDRPLIMEMSNLRLVGIAIQGYAAENDGQIPPHPRYLASFFYESVSQRDLFISPFQDEDAVLDRGEPSGAGFRYGGFVFLVLGHNLNEFEVPAESILAYSAKVSPEQIRRNVLFADGHAEQLEEEAFLAMLPDGVDVDALDGR